ncbi:MULTISPECIES: hypothetical protein [Clostridium]|uniref:hypothetical protein n=1 Tax=Clostridium TaxID=1485 RepID=UPI00069FF6CA|nr:MULTISPECIES: hypothetical protein [Clostridium]KOF56949.1 hypothetical protein AGR56_10120 [Clostridium sp. DMHC 10]MCD2347753.1 hypothetical protein [Clostridium guangxiense]
MKNSNKNKNLLYVSNKPIKAFLFLLSLPWFILSVKLIIDNKAASGIKLFVFGNVFLTVMFGVQFYFRKMLVLYQKNLDSSYNKYKKRKIIKDKGGSLK